MCALRHDVLNFHYCFHNGLLAFVSTLLSLTSATVSVPAIMSSVFTFELCTTFILMFYYVKLGLLKYGIGLIAFTL